MTADDSLRDKLAWHLFANFYPQVTPKIIPALVQAIEATRAGDHDRGIDLNGKVIVPAWQLISDLKLEELV